MVTVRKVVSACALLGLFLFLTGLLGLGLGSVSVPVHHLFTRRGLDPTSSAILWDLRLPRVLMAGVVGWSLSQGGVVFQALLRNPLAEPFLLGISSGAALGAVAGILLGLTPWGGLPFLALIGALITVGFILAVAQKARALDPNTLILTGVIINAFFAALIMFALSMASGEKLHSLLFWLYGDLGRARIKDFWILVPVTLIGTLVLYGMARPFNLMASGEEVAAQLGVEVEKSKWISLILVSLMCSAAVSFTGIIGFVGLLVPHLMRMVFGPDHRLLLPASGLFGAAFLIGADLAARTVVSPAELPVGVITAFFGAPFFIYLLYWKRRTWKA